MNSVVTFHLIPPDYEQVLLLAECGIISLFLILF